jgi:hypothetical protein
MNQYDMHRIADAIWIMRQYWKEIDKMLDEKEYCYMDINQFERMLCSISDSIGDTHY